MKKMCFSFLLLTLAACMFLMTSCSTSLVTNAGDAAVSPVDKSAEGSRTEKRDTKLLTGSFLQSWLCRDWTLDRWKLELAAMKEMGMDRLIIQCVYDWTFASGKGDDQDWESFSTESLTGLFPSAIEELRNADLPSQNNGDALEYAFMAAKENDIKIYIGLLSDNRWWNYGWGIPKLPPEKKDPVTESYFATWCEYNGRLNGLLVKDIWDRYGSRYGEQIAGWYYYNEIWNIEAGCKRKDDLAYATCIGNNINHILDAINELCPDKPIMLSPYYNKSLSSAKQYQNFWEDIFSVAEFRHGDIFAPQDCVGAKKVRIKDLDDWIGRLKEAADSEYGMRFWVNNENFTADFTPAEVSRFIQQIEATEPYAETHITFSWNHYYNPLNDNSFTSYNNELKEYLRKRSEIE